MNPFALPSDYTHFDWGAYDLSEIGVHAESNELLPEGHSEIEPMDHISVVPGELAGGDTALTALNGSGTNVALYQADGKWFAKNKCDGCQKAKKGWIKCQVDPSSPFPCQDCVRRFGSKADLHCHSHQNASQTARKNTKIAPRDKRVPRGVGKVLQDHKLDIDYLKDAVAMLMRRTEIQTNVGGRMFAASNDLIDPTTYFHDVASDDKDTNLAIIAKALPGPDCMDAAFLIYESIERYCRETYSQIRDVEAFLVPLGELGALTCPVVEWREGVKTDVTAFFNLPVCLRQPCDNVKVFEVRSGGGDGKRLQKISVEWTVANIFDLKELLPTAKRVVQWPNESEPQWIATKNDSLSLTKKELEEHATRFLRSPQLEASFDDNVHLFLGSSSTKVVSGRTTSRTMFNGHLDIDL